MAAALRSAYLSPPSRNLSPQPAPPLAHRCRFLLAPYSRRLEPTTTSPASASISTFQISPASADRRPDAALDAWNSLEEVRLSENQQDDDVPSSIKLLPITCEEQFDRIIAEAQQLGESLVILWMANWCRKCIYLKPKLEKLASDYHPRICFYCVDVNSVPQKLVNRAGVTKMPTIQLWKDSEKEAEIFGGHKAWVVVNEVRRMIENND